MSKLPEKIYIRHSGYSWIVARDEDPTAKAYVPEAKLKRAREAMDDALIHTLQWEYKGDKACPQYMETVREILAEALKETL